MYLLAPYNTSTVIRFPLVKRASVDLAKQADYATPVNGDCNISKDGGAQANPTNNINIVTGTTWNVTLSATELTAKEVIVMVRNNTAVEDQWIVVKTYGNVNAFFGGDITANNITVDLRQIVAAAVSGPATAGVLDVNVKNVNNVVANTNIVVDLRQIKGNAVSGPATAGVLDVNVKNVNNVVATSNIAADLRQIVGAAVSGPLTAGVLDVNIKNVNNAVHNANVGQYGAAVISFAANSLTAAAINANAITGAKVANDVDIRNVNGNVGSVTNNIGGNVVGTIGGLTANSLKQFFNTNSAANYNVSVAGSVVKEIADNAGGSSLTVDAILGRLNSNLVIPDQNININGNITGSINSVTGNVGAVTGNVGGNLAGSVGSVTGNVAAVTGNIGGNLAGTVGSVVGAVGSVAGDVSGNVVGTVGSVINFNAQLIDAKITTRASPAQVNAEVVDALATDAYAEPGQGTPPSTTNLAYKISHAYKVQINKLEQTNNTLSVYDATGATVDHKATVSDVNNVFTRGNMVTGP